MGGSVIRYATVEALFRGSTCIIRAVAAADRLGGDTYLACCPDAAVVTMEAAAKKNLVVETSFLNRYRRLG